MHDPRCLRVGLLGFTLYLGACAAPVQQASPEPEPPTDTATPAVYHHERLGLSIAFPPSWRVESQSDRTLPPEDSAMALLTTWESGPGPGGPNQLELTLAIDPGPTCEPPEDAILETTTRPLEPASVVAQEWRFRYEDWSPDVWKRALCVPWQGRHVTVFVTHSVGQEAKVEAVLDGIHFDP